jgi:acetate kinase
MSPSKTIVLTINGGSSSIKFALYESSGSLRRILAGGIERIGSAEAVMQVSGADPSDRQSCLVAAPDHSAAVTALMDWIMARSDAITAIGHRVVHGGPNYHEPHLVTAEMLQELHRIGPYDPEHLPEELQLIEAFRRRFPNLPQVACFDTAFHHDLPRVAQIMPIPLRFQEIGVRRYGFHGLSYAFLMRELGRLAGAGPLPERVILAHLGSGASLAAVRNGRPMDTSMGFTPAGGLMMGTRSGDLDPGLLCFLAQTDKLTPPQLRNLVNHESGLLGLSGISSDVRDLLALEDREPRAADALGLFCYQIKKWIGAFAAALGGLDALVFTGGIGENAPPIRERVCAGLGFLGLTLDNAANAQPAPVISAESSRVVVRVIRTDEQLMIALATRHLLGLHPLPAAQEATT